MTEHIATIELDAETERIIGEFAAAKWQHGHRSANDESVWPELERTGNALVALIQTLVKERDEARAVYSVCPVCNTSWTNGELADELSRLKSAPKRTINRDIEEALNSGDGTYKP